MTIANFKTMVAALVNRTAAELIVNSQDLILLSLNDARRAAQRMHDFELNKTEDAYLSTHFGGANWMTGCKTTPGGVTGLLMKRVDEVWNYTTQTVGASTYYPRTSQIDFGDSARFRRELTMQGALDNTQNHSANSTSRFAWASGSNLHISTATDATIVKLVGIQFLDDLTDASSADIFLTHFVDWLKWATIGALNIHLKDAERFPIDQALVDSMWQSVKTYDGTIANMSGAVDLE
jgi:hypothetical protein